MTERRRPRIVERSEPEPVRTSPQVTERVARRPQAIAVEDVRLEDDAFAAAPAVPPVAAKRRAVSWISVAGSALLGLIGLAVGLWIEGLVTELFQLAPAAGYVGLSLVALLIGGLTAAIFAEVRALRRFGTWREARELAQKAVVERNDAAARTVENDLLALFAKRTELAAGRRSVEDARDDILDAPDRIKLIDRALLKPLDARARELVLASAKRVAVVTAVAPRALIDVAFVLIETARLIRAIAELYGMRPGKLGFVRLCRDVVGHLAVTGAIAVGDSIVGEAFGHGVASKVSRRFGEGVLNGLMTVRIGISAMDLCRPLPFPDGERPSVGQLAKQVARSVSPGNGADTNVR